MIRTSMTSWMMLYLYEEGAGWIDPSGRLL